MGDLNAGGGDLPSEEVDRLAAVCLNESNPTASDLSDLAPLVLAPTPRTPEQVEQDERFAAAALGGSSTFFADFTDLAQNLAQNLLRSTKGLVIEAASRVGAALGIDAAVRRPHPVCPRLGVGRLCCCDRTRYALFGLPLARTRADVLFPHTDSTVHVHTYTQTRMHA